MSIGKFVLIAVLTFYYGISNAQLTYKEVEVIYDSAWTYKNLQMIPIKFKPRSDGELRNVAPVVHSINFSEALQKHKIKVQEMQYENGADVNWLQVTNHSRQNVFVQGGELLEGGKQDRMIGETKFIAPGITDYIKVFCIEKRRWSPKPKEFRNQGIANREVQKVMNLTSRQSEVWREIDRQYKAQKKTSETWSYLELYPNSTFADTGYIKFFTKKYLESDSNLAGFIFITGTQIMSTEIFGTYSYLDITFANMLNSYVQSVISKGAKPEVPVKTTKTFMDKILISEESQKAYLTAHGKIDKNDNKVIHLIAYPD